MQIVQRLFITLGGVFFAALLVAALAPKAVHGVAAALVQVTNASSNPVPNRDVDNDARQAVTLDIGTGYPPNGMSPFDLPGNNGVPYVVPAGKRLVIDYIGGKLLIANDPAAPPNIGIQFAVNTGNGPFLETIPIITQPQYFETVTSETFWTFSFPTHLYVDSTASPVQLLASSRVGSIDTVYATLSGHLVDCSTDCAPQPSQP